MYHEKESFPRLIGSRRTSKANLSISEIALLCQLHHPLCWNLEERRPLWLLKIRDTSVFLPSDLLQVAGFVHARRDAQHFPHVSVFPALAFMASLEHTSTHEDAVCSPLLQPGSYPSLQGDVQSGDPMLVSLLIHFTPLPLSAFLHNWRDLPGVSPWILRTI